MLLLSCNCPCACAITDEFQQQQHYIGIITIKRLIITKIWNNLCRSICMWLLLLLCVIFLFFICYCGCTMADEQQEKQHETVATRTTYRNQHKLLSVGELIFETDVRSDCPPFVVVVVAVTVSCYCCPGIVTVHVQLQMNHNNTKNITQ